GLARLLAHSYLGATAFRWTPRPQEGPPGGLPTTGGVRGGWNTPGWKVIGSRLEGGWKDGWNADCKVVGRRLERVMTPPPVGCAASRGARIPQRGGHPLLAAGSLTPAAP